MTAAEYLTHKSILEIESEVDLQQFEKDVNSLYYKLSELAPNGFILKSESLDSAHFHEAVQYNLVPCDGLAEYMQRFDLKNGIDFLINKNNDLCLSAYGQIYSMHGVENMTQSMVTVHFLNPDKLKYDSLLNNIEELSLSQENETLAAVFHDTSHLLQPDFIFKELRDVKNQPIDTQIHHAEEKKVNNELNKALQKTKSKSLSQEYEM